MADACQRANANREKVNKIFVELNNQIQAIQAEKSLARRQILIAKLGLGNIYLDLLTFERSLRELGSGPSGAVETFRSMIECVKK
jgi:hypothetical protein